MSGIVNGLKFDNLRGDIFGGITAAVIALPLALAMGVASGAGPIAGIYGAIFVGFFAAIFGGTPAQVSGPTGPMTVVMTMTLAHYAALFPDDPGKAVALSFTVVMLGGLFLVLFGVLKIGRYIEYVPHPVVSGFMSGIGIIIIMLQLGPMLGHESAAKPLLIAQALPDYLADPHYDTLILCAVALAIVYGIPRFLPQVNRVLPSPLVALIVGTFVYLVMMDDSGVAVLGDIPSGFPSPITPTIDLHLIPDMIKYALMLAALGAIDSLLTSLVADNITRTYHKSDRELIGQGIGNAVAGLFGGLPGAGATMRTVVNVKAGGQTPISGALHAVILLVLVLGAGSLVKDIPEAVLAGILIKVGTDIIDWDYLKRLRTAPVAGVVIMFVVFLITVFVDLITAVALGVIMANFLFMKRMTDLQIESIIAITEPCDECKLTHDEADVLEKAKGKILLFRFSGPMSFSAAKGITRRLAKFDHYDALVLDFSDVPAIDYTSSRAIEDIVVDAQKFKRTVVVAGAPPKVNTFLERQGILRRLPSGHIHSNRLHALTFAYEKIAPGKPDNSKPLMSDA